MIQSAKGKLKSFSNLLILPLALGVAFTGIGANAGGKLDMSHCQIPYQRNVSLDKSGNLAPAPGLKIISDKKVGLIEILKYSGLDSFDKPAVITLTFKKDSDAPDQPSELDIAESTIGTKQNYYYSFTGNRCTVEQQVSIDPKQKPHIDYDKHLCNQLIAAANSMADYQLAKCQAQLGSMISMVDDSIKRAVAKNALFNVGNIGPLPNKENPISSPAVAVNRIDSLSTVVNGCTKFFNLWNEKAQDPAAPASEGEAGHAPDKNTDVE